jgi:hypothetical protein
MPGASEVPIDAKAPLIIGLVIAPPTVVLRGSGRAGADTSGPDFRDDIVSPYQT